jgi:UDP-glucose 4-epimerase
LNQLGKVLVTGANGYLGSRICIDLIKVGYQVTGLCYPNITQDEVWKRQMTETVVGDLRDLNTIELLARTEFETIIHLVSLDHYQSNNSPKIVSDVNVMPTWYLLDRFTSKKSFKRFIYFSTIHVYGKFGSEVISELREPKPLNTYGLTHLLSENIVNYYNTKATSSCINIRLSNSYGSPVIEDSNCWRLVLNDLCKSAISNGQIVLKSDGTPQRDFIHSTDVIDGVKLLLNSYIKSDNNIFHLSAGKTHTILELAEAVKNIYEKMFNKKLEISFAENILKLPLSSRKERYIIDNSRLQMLGFKANVDLDMGIKEIFAYLIGKTY